MWDYEGYVHLHRKFVNNILWIKKRSFSGFEAWLDLKMGASIKDEIVRIDGIDHQNYKGSVLTSERLLAKRWRWTRSKVRRYLSRLTKESIIEIEYFKAKKISCITMMDYDKMDAEDPSTDPSTDPVNVIGSATDKALDNKKKAIMIATPTDPVKDSNEKKIKQVLDYLNKKTYRVGKRAYDYTTPEYQKQILARYAEGYKLEDFKHVVDVKVSEWRGNSKMKVYLRPTTLFGPKFKEYVMQVPSKIPRYRQMAAEDKISEPELLDDEE